MAKNRSLFSDIASRVSGSQPEEKHTPQAATNRPPHLAKNLEGVTNPRAPGQTGAKVARPDIQRLLWVDPAKCRPWLHHNRAYELLTAERCQDLIAGFRTLGRQLKPAIVRALSDHERSTEDGVEHDFEIISGVRRHWTVSWLRERGETNSKDEPYLFLVQVRDDLDALAAFELSDADNRGQTDISDYERAREYRWALDSLYQGNVSRMAEAIQMERSGLSRLIALGEMPDAVVRAYPSILDIRTHHWRELGPFFNNRERARQEAAARILTCAKALAQAREAGSRNVPSDGADTLRALLAAAKERQRGGDRTQLLETLTAKSTGKTMLKVRRTTRGITFEVARACGASKDEVVDALRKAVEEYFET
jgi:ParB family chromosome partitioning protein